MYLYFLPFKTNRNSLECCRILKRSILEHCSGHIMFMTLLVHSDRFETDILLHSSIYNMPQWKYKKNVKCCRGSTTYSKHHTYYRPALTVLFLKVHRHICEKNLVPCKLYCMRLSQFYVAFKQLNFQTFAKFSKYQVYGRSFIRC